MQEDALKGNVIIKKKGDYYLIEVITGSGGGKTTGALGLTLRAVGHEKKVIIIQFMKGRKNIGEYKIMQKLKPYYEIHQFGSKEFVNLEKPSDKDKELAEKALEFAKKSVKRKPFMLILDELCLANSVGLLKTKEIVEFLKSIPKSIHTVITGRNASKALLDLADIKVKITDLTNPEKRMPAKKGITY